MPPESVDVQSAVVPSSMVTLPGADAGNTVNENVIVSPTAPGLGDTVTTVVVGIRSTVTSTLSKLAVCVALPPYKPEMARFCTAAENV